MEAQPPSITAGLKLPERQTILQLPDGSMSLAPAYDVVPQAHLPNDGEVAPVVGGEYCYAAITISHLVAEGRARALTQAATFSEEMLAAVPELTKTTTRHEQAHAGLDENIARFTTNLLAGHATGYEPLS